MPNIREVLSLVDPDKRGWGKLWATYTLFWQLLPANAANFPTTFTTQNTSDFVAMSMRAYVTTHASPPVEVPTPQATVTYQIGTNNLQPDGTPLHLATFADNTNKDNFWELDFPIYVPRNTTMQGNITDLSGADSVVRIVFAGIRLLPGITLDLG